MSLMEAYARLQRIVHEVNRTPGGYQSGKPVNETGGDENFECMEDDEEDIFNHGREMWLLFVGWLVGGGYMRTSLFQSENKDDLGATNLAGLSGSHILSMVVKCMPDSVPAQSVQIIRLLPKGVVLDYAVKSDVLEEAGA
ncbi:hypothetical protein C5167_042220 [Papaver somniferum]|uniref:Uncharacterized protein n=1 Tax=Papaver somniferum TaxID=3469 RepID=A0A4Y7L282_PAPSO|nr:hypothetical protein C5167_042220 [Papaver somniferum]